MNAWGVEEVYSFATRRGFIIQLHLDLSGVTW